ncbi:hypothetical protein KAJ27_01580 [bacterium]|nr:hypothetical protein [bacterium]
MYIDLNMVCDGVIQAISMDRKYSIGIKNFVETIKDKLYIHAKGRKIFKKDEGF